MSSLPPMFYCENLSSIETEGVLSAQESQHASGSRRLRSGDSIHLFDGAGNTAVATVNESQQRRALAFTINERSVRAKPGSRLIVASAVPKGDRQNTMLDMLTQLGVTDFQPVIFEHSAWRQPKLPDRWQRILLEASKQCRRPWLPQLHSPVAMTQLLQQLQGCPQCFVADHSGESIQSLQPVDAAVDCTIIIGPEGGYSAAERDQLTALNAKTISVAENVLRVEAAAVAATAVVMASRTVERDSRPA